MDTTLDKLFESTAKARLLKLFLMNHGAAFSLHDIARQAQLKRESARKELAKLLKLGLVKKKMVSVKNPKTRKSKRVQAFATDPAFKLFPELKLLVLKANPANRTELTRRLNAIGGVKFAALAGVFINSDNSRIDLLVVGDKIKRERFRRFLSRLESEVGKELSYVLMTPAELRYRMDMYDRFIRDILEFPHEKLVNKLGL